MTIYPVVCPANRMVKACEDKGGIDEYVAACTWHAPNENKCWIIAEDSEMGAKALFHEHAHCAGRDENWARCDDWPGEDPDTRPDGQFCAHGWPRGLAGEK